MTSWTHPYTAFLNWRTRPSRDLVQGVHIVAPRQIIDLGYGPGNITDVCGERWPDRCWVVGDIANWALQPLKPGEQVDLIFSSAALQWIEDHATIFPRLIEKLSRGNVWSFSMNTGPA